MPMVQQQSLCLGFEQEWNGCMGRDRTQTPGWQQIAYSSNSTRHKYLYQQMALTILKGPLGKGKQIALAGCIMNGICTLLPEEEGNYMGHKEE
jgi:hypothetical protein